MDILIYRENDWFVKYLRTSDDTVPILEAGVDVGATFLTILKLKHFQYK